MFWGVGVFEVPVFWVVGVFEVWVVGVIVFEVPVFWVGVIEVWVVSYRDKIVGFHDEADLHVLILELV